MDKWINELTDDSSNSSNSSPFYTAIAPKALFKAFKEDLMYFSQKMLKKYLLSFTWARRKKYG